MSVPTSTHAGLTSAKILSSYPDAFKYNIKMIVTLLNHWSLYYIAADLSLPTRNNAVTKAMRAKKNNINPHIKSDFITKLG